MMTTDTAREWTDKQLAKTNHEVAKIYKQAQKELTEKWNDYMEKGEAKLASLDDAYFKALFSNDEESATIAKRKLIQAEKAYTLQSDYYKEMVNSVTRELAQVNQQALSYINGTLSDIYATNYEQANDLVKSMGLSFTLADKSTIKRMIKDGDIKLPKKKLNIPKDMQWNTKRINSAVLQGILQGESMNKIADRLLPIVDSNRASAMRNARTLVTGAENRGRLDSYKELEEQGLVMKKVWIATDGDRTREWHLDMDGQEVDIDEPFIDGHGNEVMYPADPDAEPETVYNCRCSMRMRVVGVKQKEEEEEGFDDSEALEYWDNTNNDEEPQSDLDAFMDEYGNIPITSFTPTPPPSEEEETDTAEMPEKIIAEVAQGEEMISEFDADEWMRELENRHEFDTDEVLKHEKWCREWLEDITVTEQDAVELYTGSAYRSINEYLNGLSNSTPYMQEIEDCQRALAKASYPETQIVRRGSSERSLNLLFENSPETMEKILNRDFDDMVGSIITPPSFLSTSPFVEGGFTHMDVEYFIKIPEGAQAMYVDIISKNRGELETLINKDLPVYVHEIREGTHDNGSNRLEVFLEVLK